MTRLAASLAAASLLLQACVMVPRTLETYDPDCQIVRKQMELQPTQVNLFVGCSNDGCLSTLVFVGATSAASFVVSGSIVLIGNLVYWMERQGRCPRAPAS